MLNEWVRLTYGALAIEDFQESSAQVQVAYTFKSYVPVEGKNLNLHLAEKRYTLQLPILLRKLLH